MNRNSAPMMPKVLMAILGVLFFLSLSWFCYANYQVERNAWNVAVSAVLLSIPLALLYFSIGLLVAAWQTKLSGEPINKRMARYIYLTPRIAGILIILFVAMFALDVFSGNESFWMKLGGFIIHAFPAIAMAVLLALAWRWEWIGFAAFLCAAIYFLRFIFGNPNNNYGIVLLFSAPMAVIALLFWANWKWKRDIRQGNP